MNPLACMLLLLPAALQTTTSSVQEPPKSFESHVYFMAEEFITAKSLTVLVEKIQQAHAPVFSLSFERSSDGRGALPSRLTDAVRSSDLLDGGKQAQLIDLRGGHFMGWYDLAYPKRFRSYLPKLLTDAAKAKKPFLVTGGACAFLSGGVLVPRAELEKTQRNPQRAPDAPEARVSLDLGPGMMFGSDCWQDSSPLRLLQAMHDNHVKRGAYFVGQVLLDFDRSTRTLVVHGPGHLILIDLTRARIFPDGVRRGRLSFLGAGDSWKVGSAPLRMAPAKQPGAPVWQDTPEPSWKKPARLSGRQLFRLVDSPRPASYSGETKAAHWTLGWDARSERQARADRSGHRSWLNVPFDCLWTRER